MVSCQGDKVKLSWLRRNQLNRTFSPAWETNAAKQKKAGSAGIDL